MNRDAGVPGGRGHRQPGPLAPSAIADDLRQDYVRTAWAKGLKERRLVLRHAVKNALIPVAGVTPNCSWTR